MRRSMVMERFGGRGLTTSILGCLSSSQPSGARESNKLQEKQKEKKRLKVLPTKLEKEVAYHG